MSIASELPTWRVPVGQSRGRKPRSGARGRSPAECPFVGPRPPRPVVATVWHNTRLITATSPVAPPRSDCATPAPATSRRSSASGSSPMPTARRSTWAITSARCGATIWTAMARPTWYAAPRTARPTPGCAATCAGTGTPPPASPPAPSPSPPPPAPASSTPSTPPVLSTDEPPWAITGGFPSLRNPDDLRLREIAPAVFGYTVASCMPNTSSFWNC